MRKELSEHMENYLETIYDLVKEKKVARVKDIAKRLNIKMPSVTEAVRKLSKKGLVNFEKYGYITLTKKGEKLAENLETYHKTFEKFFRDILGVNPEIASKDACRIEHIISEETFRKLIKFMQLFSNLEENILSHFRKHLKEDSDSS